MIQLSFFSTWFPINCYLIDERETFTLIDTGLPFFYKGILKVAHNEGKPISRIILTHGHGDHVGALDHLKELLPNVEVIISQRDAKLLRGDVTLEENETPLPIKGDIPKKIKTVPDRLVSDGDRIGHLRVFETAGHTPGHIALLDERNHSLIAGDAFQVKGGIAVSGVFKPLFPFPAMATWNKHEALLSAKKLEQLSPSLLAVGHGRMIKNPIQDMNKAILQAEHKLQRIKNEKKNYEKNHS